MKLLFPYPTYCAYAITDSLHLPILLPAWAGVPN